MNASSGYGHIIWHTVKQDSRWERPTSINSLGAVVTRLPPWRVLAYAVLGFPIAFLGLHLLLVIPELYARETTLGLALVGTLLLIARVWDVISDPLVGILSDRWGGFIGRRRSVIMLGIPLLGSGLYWFFFPNTDTTALTMLASAFVVYLGWTMISLPYGALGAELSGDYKERNTITAWRTAFVMLGTIAGSVLAAQSDMQLSSLIIIIGLVLGGCLLLAVPDTTPPLISEKLSWHRATKVLLANRPFKILLLAFFINGIAASVPASLFLFYTTYVLAAPTQTGLMLLTYFGAGILGIPLWAWLGSRYGKHRAWLVSIVWACLFFALVPFLGQGDGWLFWIICLATGLSYGADLVLPASMQADVIDVDTEGTGQIRTGSYFALWGMASKLAQALSIGLTFPILDLAGFMPAPNNAAGALTTLAWLYGGLPVVFKLLAGLVMLRYPITAEEQRARRQRLKQQGVVACD